MGRRAGAAVAGRLEGGGGVRDNRGGRISAGEIGGLGRAGGAGGGG